MDGGLIQGHASDAVSVISLYLFRDYLEVWLIIWKIFLSLKSQRISPIFWEAYNFTTFDILFVTYIFRHSHFSFSDLPDHAPALSDASSSSWSKYPTGRTSHHFSRTWVRHSEPRLELWPYVVELFLNTSEVEVMATGAHFDTFWPINLKEYNAALVLRKLQILCFIPSGCIYVPYAHGKAQP